MLCGPVPPSKPGLPVEVGVGTAMAQRGPCYTTAAATRMGWVRAAGAPSGQKGKVKQVVSRQLTALSGASAGAASVVSSRQGELLISKTGQRSRPAPPRHSCAGHGRGALPARASQSQEPRAQPSERVRRLGCPAWRGRSRGSWPAPLRRAGAGPRQSASRPAPDAPTGQTGAGRQSR